MKDQKVIDARRYTTEPRRLKLIWADRLALVVFALVWGCASVIELLSNDFATSQSMLVNTESALCVAIPVWLLCRGFHFMFSGRLR